MNPNIALLAQGPRGKAFRSQLIPYDADIWRWLAAGETYRQIALNLEERGVKVSLAAVHQYVAVRVRRRDSLKRMPGPLRGNADEFTQTPKPSLLAASRPELQPAATTTNTHAQKEYIFIPHPVKHFHLQDDELAFNDPTAI